MSPSGKAVATLTQESGGVARVEVYLIGTATIGKGKLVPIDASDEPMLIFFGKHDTDGLFIATRKAGGRTSLLRYELGRGKILNELHENDDLVFVNVSPKTGYATPHITIRTSSPEMPGTSYRVFGGAGLWSVIPSVEKITPVEQVGATPDKFVGVQEHGNGVQDWYYIVGGRARLLTSIASLDVSRGSTFVSTYVDADYHTKAAFIEGKDTDKVALKEYDLSTGTGVVRFEGPADLDTILVNPETKIPLAVGYEYERLRWHSLDGPIAHTALERALLSSSPPRVISVAADGNSWLAGFDVGTPNLRYRIRYERGEYLRSPPALSQSILYSPADSRPMLFTTKDGVKIVAYLSFPVQESPCTKRLPCPLLVNVHGGPRLRDRSGFNKETQLFTHRGYAVLNVNYRGSRGFGRTFELLASGDWGGKEVDDVIEVTRHVLKDKNLDSRHTAIMGGSHGALIALNALERDPTLFQCGVAISATTDLAKLIEFHRSKNTGLAEDLIRNIGDPDHPGEIKAIRSRSPITNVQNIVSPVLLIHGQKDNSAPFGDVVAFSSKLQELGKTHTFMYAPLGGHQLANSIYGDEIYSVTERFLLRCLGGLAEGSAENGLRSYHDDLKLAP